MRSHHFRGNVFVANLPPEFTDDELAATFDSFGMVLSASIARDPANGKRLRYGFVAVGSDIGILARGAEALAAKFKS